METVSSFSLLGTVTPLLDDVCGERIGRLAGPVIRPPLVRQDKENEDDVKRTVPADCWVLLQPLEGPKHESHPILLLLSWKPAHFFEGTSGCLRVDFYSRVQSSAFGGLG